MPKTGKTSAAKTNRKPAPMIKCPKCGTANQAGAKKCWNCGWQLDIVPPEKVDSIPVHPPKNKHRAFLLEILPGLIGILGIGWITAGNRRTGFFWLIGAIVWDLFTVGATIFTQGTAIYATLPIYYLMLVMSVISLNGFMSHNQDIFGA
jgi:hypothetical protein